MIIPIFVMTLMNPIADTCVGITRISIMNMNAGFLSLKSYAYSPYAVSAEKYVASTAQHEDTIRLFFIPESTGSLASWMTLLKFFEKELPGRKENPACIC